MGLLVGIEGGIARPDEGMDIRLRVIVSQPDRATGGVVQYDLVKAKSGGERERKDFLNMPPPVLLHALAHLQAEHLVAGSKLPALLKDMWRGNPPPNGKVDQVSTGIRSPRVRERQALQGVLQTYRGLRLPRLRSLRGTPAQRAGLDRP